MNIISKDLFSRLTLLIVSALVLVPPVAAQLNYGSPAQFGASTTIASIISPGGAGCPGKDVGTEGRHTGVDGSAAASDQEQIGALGARHESAASANVISKTVRANVIGEDGSCEILNYLGEPYTTTIRAQGNAQAAFYDTYTVSSAERPLNDPVELTLTWQLNGTFSALIPKGPNGTERGTVYFQTTVGGQTVTREFFSSQGTEVNDRGRLRISSHVGDSFTVQTRISVQVSHPDGLISTGVDTRYALFNANFSASTVPASTTEGVVVTRTADLSPSRPSIR